MAPRTMDPVKRFWSKVDKTATCWLWTAGLNMGGYGRFAVNRYDTDVAHKWIWETINGPVPTGMQLDHLCRIRNCVNPNHLEIVTPRVNTLRGTGPSANNFRKTHCPKGHAYDVPNTRITPAGGRVCRACMRIRNHVVRSKTKNGAQND